MKRIALTLLLLTSFSIGAQKLVLLKLNYKKGDVYKLKMEMKQGLGLMGGMNMNAEMRMNVVNVNDQDITSETRMERIAVDVLQGANTMSFDSSAKEEDLDVAGKQMKAQFDPMMKAVITQVMSRSGKIVDIKVEPQVPGMDNFGQPSEYPTTPITVGSTWSVETSDNATGIIKITYKVDNITETTVYASITGTATGLPGSEITGKIEVDIASGNPNKSEVLVSADAQGQKITVNTLVTSTKVG